MRCVVITGSSTGSLDAISAASELRVQVNNGTCGVRGACVWACGPERRWDRHWHWDGDCLGTRVGGRVAGRITVVSGARTSCGHIDLIDGIVQPLE